MPNLQQIISLKEKYGSLNSEELKAKEFIERSRIQNDSIKKAFSFNERRLIENFDVVHGRPDLITYFENGPIEEIVLLFVDITNFSAIIQNKTAAYLKSYLDEYYKFLIPIIYNHKGQIEKIMGDGIICVFGKPFLPFNVLGMSVNYAENCAQKVIHTFKSTDKAVKVAIHTGSVTYYKIPSESYEEYTMIGSPLTELYRLESVSVGDAINFFKGSAYDALNPRDGFNLFTDIHMESVALYDKDIALPGVSYNEMRYLKFI